MAKSKSLIKTTITALGLLHCINKVIDSVAINHTTTRTSGKFYHWKHGDIFYRVSGSGSPILLVHDLNVSSSNYEYLPLVESLSKRHTVYNIDLIGCGRSDKPALTYTNYFYVQMISDFVKDIIQEKTDIAATGLSSSFVMMANQMNHALFDKIYLINPKSISSLKRVPDQYANIILRLFELPIIGKTAYYMAVSKMNIENYLTEEAYYNPFNLKPSTSKIYYDAAHCANGNGKFLFASLQAQYLNADITEAVKSASNEIIIINGEHRQNREAIEQSYQQCNPSILFCTINDAALLPQLESPEEVLSFMI